MRLFHRLILFFFTLSQLAWTGTPETNRTLRVGVYENPPMSFYEDGVAQGFVIDLLESIAEEEDWELDYVPCQWSQCLEMLETGEIDLLGPIAYSQERAEQFAFNEETYFTNWGAIYAQPGQEIETFLDLDGIPLAVLQDDIFTTSLKNLLGKLDIQPEYLEVGNYSSVLEAVDSGAAQAGLVNRLFGRLHAQDYNFIETPILFHPIEVRFAAPKESDPEILTIIDNYLDNWKSRDHSPYTQALDRWLTVPQPWRISARLKWALIALIGGLLGFLGIALGLRWLVKKRTNELKASQERHQALLAGIPDLMFIQNQQGTYLDFHAPYPDMLFAPPEEFLGKTPHDVFPEEYADWFQELITKAIRTNENQVHEYELPIAGQKRYLESRIVPFAEDKVLSIIREITTRKEAEEKLAFRHQLWEALMKNTHDLVYFKNKNHGIIMASQAYANAVGFEREELLEKSAADLWPHEAEEIIADERQVLAGDPLIQKERKATTATGESRWYLLSKVPIFKNEEVIGFFATDKDITEYKQVEKALRESENRYRSLFENAPIGICSVNQEGQILEANASLLKILGSPSQEATKRINALTFPPLVKAGIAKSLQHCFETRKSTSKETLYESKWGKSIHAHYRVTPNHIKNGQVVTAQILVEDITERKQAEETSTRLYEETQQLATFNQNIIESMDEGIVLEDADGFFTFVNPAAAKLLGYMPEKLTGLHWTDIIPADQHAIVQETDKRRMRGESDRYEVELIRRDGERISTLVSGSPRFDERDRFIGTMAVFTDITERVQAVAALRASENRYRQIFETNQAIKLIIDHSDGKIKDANKAACEFYGYDVNTLTSMRINDINTLPEEEIQREMEKAQKEERAQFNFKHRLASGEIREVEVYSGPFQVENKTLLYSIIQDITEKKKAEEALKASETKYKALFEGISDAVFVHSMQEEGFNKFIAVNETACKQLGYTREELLEMSSQDISDPEGIESRANTIGREEFREDQWAVFESTHITKNGLPIPVEVSSRIFTFEDQPMIMSLARDISKRKKMEEAQRIAEHRYRALFDQSHDAVFILDLEGKHLEANLRASELLGYSKEEIKDLSYQDLSAELEESQHTLEKLLSEDPIQLYERIFRKKDGTTIPVEINVELVYDPEGHPMHIQSVVRDITARKEMEKQLRQQEQLAAVGQLAAGIAHDFRNRLTSTILYAGLILRQSNLPPSQVENLKIIIEESEKASGLVQQILDFGRRSILQVQTIDLRELTQDLIKVLKHTIPENIHLLFSSEVKSTMPFTIEADSGRIEQVLINLATNARDAMPQGGELHFTLSQEVINPGETPPVIDLSPGAWICLAVSDTGTGITEEVKEHIFEPFFTTKDVGKGTGLGLAQVYGIIRQHEGYINVETEVGEGTTFEIYLEASAKEPMKKREKESTPSPQGQGETILLVEDDGTLRTLAQDILITLGYQVLAASNGQEGLEIYETEKKIDLVITDLIMPKMGGVELIKNIKRTEPDLKALSITGYAGKAPIEDVKETGFLDVISKPFEMETFAQKVRQTLDS